MTSSTRRTSSADVSTPNRDGVDQRRRSPLRPTATKAGSKLAPCRKKGSTREGETAKSFPDRGKSFSKQVVHCSAPNFYRDSEAWRPPSRQQIPHGSLGEHLSESEDFYTFPSGATGYSRGSPGPEHPQDARAAQSRVSNSIYFRTSNSGRHRQRGPIYSGPQRAWSEGWLS